ncbi:calcineurin-like phosphoesterase family protein [Rhodobium orientis]|nr:metallophosphoesterase [Rhodobium orientis]MBB4301541.1 calcineurin-like phosphoesterase family protein [Rhodobium orientis]
MAGSIFFTSDTHFGDAGVLDDRPFSSVPEMDSALIANWNSTVACGDTVYHLGDFCHRETGDASPYLDRLNGTVHLVRGNHDDRLVRDSGALFASVDTMLEERWNGCGFVLFHFPMRDWPNAIRGARHLFGHVHGVLNGSPLGKSLDVGVDSHDYTPVSLARVEELLDALPEHWR